MSGLMFAKPRPRALEKKDRAKAKQSAEGKQDAIVKARSGGQCEVREQTARDGLNSYERGRWATRCGRRAFHVHHLLGGFGKRGVRESALSENKLHVCEHCHDLIHKHILQTHWKDVNDRAGTSYFVRLK